MKNLLTVLILLFGLHLTGQDYIILVNGDEIEAKVLEINDKNIDYKKFSNINGPTYHLKKSEIFMIKYQSGDKDVFSGGNTKPQTSQVSNNIHDNPKDFVYNSNFGTSNCQAQKSRGAKIFGNRANEVFFRQDIVYYGYDLTYLKLSNPKKMGQSVKLIQEYFNDWNNVLNDKVGFNQLSKWMNKPHMLMGTPIFQNYYKRDFNNFVEYGNFFISFEDLQKIINSYVINESQGIGMVINVVNFNKDREYSMQWVTFFDIATREIIFAILTTGNAGGGGMVGHWAEGVEVGVRGVFVDEIFKRKLSNNGMIPSKLRLY
ncbi:MAG: hypothetical protein HQ521_18255 [Bacteroidetes bacterium]|nr:hypothetical protein [Bacteroidota bacterium]